MKPTLRKPTFLIATLFLATCFVSTVGLPLSIGDIRSLSDFSDLPLLRPIRVYEVTNWRGAMAAKATLESPGRFILLDEKGPGCVVRTMIFTLEGTVKVYFDGSVEPEIDVPLKSMYADWRWWEQGFDADKQSVFPFVMNLSLRGAGYRNNCYLPFSFARSVKVVWEPDADKPLSGPPRFCFVISGFEPGTEVASYMTSSMKQQEATVRQVAAAWRRLGAQPCSYADARTATGSLKIPAGKSIDLFKQEGGGTIVGLRLRAQPWHRAIDRFLVLRAYWDGEERPSVETPIGDFCASHRGIKQGNVLPAGGGDWYFCYFPMPFAKGARLTLENLSHHAISWLDYEVTVRDQPPTAKAGRFCARWHRQTLTGDEGATVPFNLLEATGAGKLVGYNLRVSQVKSPMISNYPRQDRLALYLDGEQEPRFAGPSLMHYFNGGWYGGSCWDSPLSGNSEWDDLGGSYAEFRSFLNDAPVWERSARLAFEVELADDGPKEYSCVACWYRSTDGRDATPGFTRDDLVLPTLHIPDSIEAEDLIKGVEISAGDLLVMEDVDGRFNAMGGKFISFAPHAEGDTLTVTVPVEKAGRYHVDLRKVCSPSGGIWKVMVNGKGAADNQPTIEFLGTEPFIAENWPPLWWRHGQFDFVAGDNKLVFTAMPTYPGRPQRGLLLSLDALWLEEVKR